MTTQISDQFPDNLRPLSVKITKMLNKKYIEDVGQSQASNDGYSMWSESWYPTWLCLLVVLSY